MISNRTKQIAIIAGTFFLCSCTIKSPSTADLSAITTVVEHAYAAEGQDRIVFLDIDPSNQINAVQARSMLEADLGVKVRSGEEASYENPDLPPLTPVLSETGEIGVSVRLGRFVSNDDGTVSVRVGVTRSGLDGQSMLYTIDPTTSGWEIVDVTYEEAIP